MNFYNEDKLSAMEAMGNAQWIAFAPMVFQAARSLRNFGVLSAIEKRKHNGMVLSEVENECKLSAYSARVLCEAGLAIGLLYYKEDKYYTTKTAVFFCNDNLTETNCDFVNDVCYQGLFYLEDSILKGTPEGLKNFGNWKTIYEALSELPPKVKESWYKFDHYYSDQSFKEALPTLFSYSHRSILDIGGNTGRFALQCLSYSPEVRVVIMDIPSQLSLAKEIARKNGVNHRMDFIQADILDESCSIPAGFDIIWMSQFLDCFSDEQVISILKRCALALDDHARVCILEPFWDRQRFKASAFSLQMTSLYFTSIANGNSQMYRSDVFFNLIDKAGLDIEAIHDGIGLCHTLLVCKNK